MYTKNRNYYRVVGSHEQLLSWDAAISDSSSDLLLIHIHHGSIQVSVSQFLSCRQPNFRVLIPCNDMNILSFIRFSLLCDKKYNLLVFFFELTSVVLITGRRVNSPNF
ncbi:hypothetical protein TRVA0_076S00232 [Trichomonascus vanleenenianus]|uniref:uncharacterized protein n=1 Tax=Trichomonascus vanleenenianus TaxID=2268995 RepID=UPI003ECB86B2